MFELLASRLDNATADGKTRALKVGILHARVIVTEVVELSIEFVLKFWGLFVGKGSAGGNKIIDFALIQKIGLGVCPSGALQVIVGVNHCGDFPKVLFGVIPIHNIYKRTLAQDYAQCSGLRLRHRTRISYT